MGRKARRKTGRADPYRRSPMPLAYSAGARPIRNSSTARAHCRPSRIAQTTSDWPRRMSPAANTLSTRRAVVVGIRLHVAARIALDAELLEQAGRTTGPVKPIASSTRSALIANSLPGTSTIFIAPSASFCHSTRAAIELVDLAVRPSKRLVATAQSREQPSSCDDDVRSLIGQYGQVSGLFSCSGGCGSSSNCVIDAAPWRFDVPTQSEPVSPPPMTTTCLPVAMIWSGDAIAGDDLVLLRQELHREMHAVEVAPRHRQVARLLGAAGRARPRRTPSAIDSAATSRPTCDARRGIRTPSARHLRHAPVDQRASPS